VALSVESPTHPPGFIPALAGWGGAWPAARVLRVTTLKGGAPRAAEVALAFPCRIACVRIGRFAIGALQGAPRQPERRARK